MLVLAKGFYMDSCIGGGVSLWGTPLGRLGFPVGFPAFVGRRRSCFPGVMPLLRAASPDPPGVQDVDWVVRPRLGMLDEAADVRLQAAQHLLARATTLGGADPNPCW